MDWLELRDYGMERHRALLNEAARQRERRSGRRSTLRVRVAGTLIALGHRLLPAEEQGAALAGARPAHAES